MESAFHYGADCPFYQLPGFVPDLRGPGPGLDGVDPAFLEMVQKTAVCTVLPALKIFFGESRKDLVFPRFRRDFRQHPEKKLRNPDFHNGLLYVLYRVFRLPGNTFDHATE